MSVCEKEKREIKNFVDGTRRWCVTSLQETLSNTWNCSNKLQLYVVNITISNIMLLLTEYTCVVCRVVVDHASVLISRRQVT